MIISRIEYDIKMAEAASKAVGIFKNTLIDSDCEHDWDKWKEPQESDITQNHYSLVGGSGVQSYKGLSQIRFCKKCNFAQRHVV